MMVSFLHPHERPFPPRWSKSDLEYWRDQLAKVQKQVEDIEAEFQTYRNEMAKQVGWKRTPVNPGYPPEAARLWNALGMYRTGHEHPAAILTTRHGVIADAREPVVRVAWPGIPYGLADFTDTDVRAAKLKAFTKYLDLRRTFSDDFIHTPGGG